MLHHDMYQIQQIPLLGMVVLPKHVFSIALFVYITVLPCPSADLHTKFSSTRPPMGPNSFIFTHIFTKKHPRRRSTTSRNGSTPPTRNPGSAPAAYIYISACFKNIVKQTQRYYSGEYVGTVLELVNK